MKSSKNVSEQRVRHRAGEEAAGGKFVLYWMQASQRTYHNDALEYAIQRANFHDKPLVVCFGLMPDYPEANARHFVFMLEGLAEVERNLRERGIAFVMRRGHPAEVALQLAEDAVELVTDRGYLRHQKAWRKTVAERAPCPVFEVEADVVVPVDEVSQKEEYAARTIRPKITKQSEDYLLHLNPNKAKHSSLKLGLKSNFDLSDPHALVADLPVDHSVKPVSKLFRGGEEQARSVFRKFLRDSFSVYDEHRNQPQTSDVSFMSMHLHFGQVSPAWLVLEARDKGKGSQKNLDSFEEELMVRRELAINFVHHNDNYDSLDCVADWARQTMREHEADERETIYTKAQLDNAETHDEYWNASMREMRYTGYMHNYMRMYWGKQFIAWTHNARTAHSWALELNNRYFLDGRDANSFTGVAWCFGKHDRGWTEREVFGKVRIMKASGLERKCDIKAYVEKVDRLCEKVAD